MNSSRSKSEDSRVKIVTTECSGEDKHQNEVCLKIQILCRLLNDSLFRMPHFLPLNSRNYLCPKIPQEVNQVKYLNIFKQSLSAPRMQIYKISVFRSRKIKGA